MKPVQCVVKTFRILQSLDIHGDWMGVRELARTVGLTPPTTHNLLNTLKSISYVETNPATKQYRLGLAAIRLGEGANPLNQMRDFARPYLEALANEFDETVVALSWVNSQAIVIDWIQADHPLAATHNHGVIEHPVVFASGRVLLGFQDSATQRKYAAQEDLSRFGPNSPITPEDLLLLLHQTANDGYAITTNVANSGIAAVATPVFDANHKIVLAIGCSAPVSRVTKAQIEIVKQRLLDVTEMMSQKLGAKPQAHSKMPAA